MNRRIGLVGTYVIGAILSGAGSASTAELASPATGALVQTDPIPFWWFHGTVEVGGRFFLNNPQDRGQAYERQKSLAKYYEYSTIQPGAFSNVWMATGSRDGRYQVDLGGENIGYSDQSYYLDFSEAGKHYLSLGWDQTPHIYSRSALTPYNLNGNALTLVPGVPPTNNAKTLTPFLHQTDIDIARDTASAKYRWTPNDAWDINAEVSHMRRTGTQPAGVRGLAFGVTQISRPVDDTTQNYGVNGEYAGTAAWGGKITAKVGYFGSQYTNDYAAYTVQNSNNANPIPFAQISLPPSNQANGFNGTIAAELPWKSRYVGTLSYNMMRQDAAFIPMTANPAAAPYVLPASSLNGQINNLLSNNVVTTRITPELTSKLSYRYYDFQNNTPELFFPNWIPLDGAGPGNAAHTIRSLSINYTKQNAGAELTWRPSREWNLGAAYGFERYDYTRVDTDATNENSGKVFIDWKPTSWFIVRSSGSYSNRRHETYDYLGFVGNYQFPNPASTAWRYESNYRQLMISNRESWKANFFVDLVAVRGLTITPTFKYQDDNYSVDPTNQLGLADRRLWSGGIDVTYLLSPTTSFTVGYARDYVTQLLFGTSCTQATAAGPGGCFTAIQVPPAYKTLTDDKMVVNTFTALVRHAAIPNKLDTELRYVASYAIDALRLYRGDGAIPTGGQFPDMQTWYQRLDATATYRFDPAVVAQLGWTGDVKAKLRYTWERNSVNWWATDFFGVGTSTAVLFNGWDNPNYNVHLLAASLQFTW